MYIIIEKKNVVKIQDVPVSVDLDTVLAVVESPSFVKNEILDRVENGELECYELVRVDRDGSPM